MSKFKVGDKVRFINDDSLNAKFFEHGLDNLEIKRVFSEDKEYCVYESDKSKDWYVQEHELELVEEALETPADIKKFSVGDIVVNNPDNSGTYSITTHSRGFVGKIIDIDSNKINVEIIEHEDSCRIGREFHVNPEHFILRQQKEDSLKKEVKMETKDIETFDKAILKEAEAAALEEIRQEQKDIAKAKFKEMHLKVMKAKKKAAEAKNELEELKSSLAKITPKK